MSPIPSASSVPRPTADFSEPDHFVPGLGDAEVQRVRDLLAQQAVRGDRVGHVRRLDRDLEVGELEALHQLDELHAGGHQRLDGVLALELVQVLGQRAGVDADPHRRAGRARLVGDLGDLLGPADVARVQADAVRTGVDRLQRQRVVEVDVGDHGDRRLLDDRLERLDVLLARDGDPHEVGAGVRDGADLRHRGGEVRRLRLRHRLHGDGRAAADLDAADGHMSLGGHALQSRRSCRRSRQLRPAGSTSGLGHVRAARGRRSAREEALARHMSCSVESVSRRPHGHRSRRAPPTVWPGAHVAMSSRG